MLSLKNVLLQFGIEVEESELYFRLGLFVYEYRFNTHNIWLPVESVPSQISIYGLESIYYSEGKRYQFESILKENSFENAIYIAMVDTAKLRYSNIYLKNPSRIHSIIIFGADETNFNICDAKIRNECGGISIFIGDVDKEQILNASINLTLFKVNKLNRQKKIVDTNLQNIVLKNLKTYLNGGKKEENMLGKDALIHIVDEIANLGNANNFEDVHFEIKIAILENLFFLKEILSNKGMITNDYLKDLTHIESQWEIIAHMVLKAGIIGDFNIVLRARNLALDVVNYQLNTYQRIFINI